MSEPFDVERNCGNCQFFKPDEHPKGFGTCNYPIPAWLLAMLYKARLVSVGYGHNCDCHKLKD